MKSFCSTGGVSVATSRRERDAACSCGDMGSNPNAQRGEYYESPPLKNLWPKDALRNGRIQ